MALFLFNTASAESAGCVLLKHECDNKGSTTYPVADQLTDT